MPQEPVDGISFELIGVPDRVVAAFQRRAEFERAMEAKQRAPVVHVPERQEPVARPREQRPRRRVKTAARGDPDDDPAPGRAGLPEFRVIPPAEFRRQLDAALGGRA